MAVSEIAKSAVRQEQSVMPLQPPSGNDGTRCDELGSVEMLLYNIQYQKQKKSFHRTEDLYSVYKTISDAAAVVFN